ARNHAFEQAENAAHPRSAIESRYEMHLGGARIGKAHIGAASEQRLHQAFGSIHRPVRHFVTSLFTRARRCRFRSKYRACNSPGYDMRAQTVSLAQAKCLG